MTSKNNSRIAKNTAILSLRLLLTMVVSLYTVRIVLKVLGIEDYGIYGVIGGMVSLFVFMNGSLSSLTARFLSFELGLKEPNNIKNTFRSAFTINIIFALIVFIFMQTVGLWFINNNLNIPDDRLYAANWVYHMSVLCSVLSIIQTPLTALIVAHEDMGIYAYFGILDVLMKLCVVLLLQYSGYDKLISYSFLMLITSSIIFLFYHIYCKIKYQEYLPRLLFDKKILKNMAGFSAWSFIGSFSVVMKLQGVDILLNIFFGPSVNAARAIAYQVNNAVSSFTQNLTTALSPQIIKYYAAGEINNMTDLVVRGSKISYFLLFILSLPIIFEAEFVLNLWLDNVPNYAVILTKLVIINSLLESFAYVMNATVYATGQIRAYQVMVGGFLLLNLPLSYLFLKVGYPPQTVLIISIVLALCSLSLRILIIKKQIPQFPVKEFFYNVFGIAALVSLLAILAPLYVGHNLKPGWNRFILVTISCFITTVSSIWFFGLKRNERRFIIDLARKIKE